MSAQSIAEYERKIAEQEGRIEYILNLTTYWMAQFDAERERAEAAEAKVALYMRRVESAEEANDALAADARRLEEERNTAVATLAMVRMTLARTVDNLATAVA